MSSAADTDEGDDEPHLVLVAREVRASRRHPVDFDAAFARATVHIQRTVGRRRRRMGLLIMADCTDYPATAELADVYLEDSHVLDVIDEPPIFTFKIDAVLTPDHPHYRAPGPAEQYCYATGRLVFRNVSRVEWERRSTRRYTDAAGEQDMGNVDFLKFCGDHWYAGGDWGKVRIFTVARPQLDLAGARDRAR